MAPLALVPLADEVQAIATVAGALTVLPTLGAAAVSVAAGTGSGPEEGRHAGGTIRSGGDEATEQAPAGTLADEAGLTVAIGRARIALLTPDGAGLVLDCTQAKDGQRPPCGDLGQLPAVGLPANATGKSIETVGIHLLLSFESGCSPGVSCRWGRGARHGLVMLLR